MSMELFTREWKSFRVDEIFNLEYHGKRIDSQLVKDNPGTTPVMTCGAGARHGISGYMNEKNVSGIHIRKNMITAIGATGSGAAFYIESGVALSQQMTTLELRDEQYRIKEVYLFLLTILRKTVLTKYSVSNLLIPDKLKQELLYVPITSSNTPDYKFMCDYINSIYPDLRYVKGAVNNQAHLSLDTSTWKEYKLTALFNIAKGTISKKTKQGKTVCITATCKNNGIGGSTDVPPVHNGNSITLSVDGSIGEAFYQARPFSANTAVAVLSPLEATQLNKYTALFICTILRKEGQKYSYDYKWSLVRLKDTTIKLPSTPSGEPDWKFMEDYIKQLPYSAGIA